MLHGGVRVAQNWIRSNYLQAHARPALSQSPSVDKSEGITLFADVPINMIS